eukprot:GHVH01008843.1.p1 GENE.GHVH01008843.1~~GHVH01008843.1.p1  ORF type:complete len:564 (+),score=56.80 GHVH01008843.1:30-1694(+)
MYTENELPALQNPNSDLNSLIKSVVITPRPSNSFLPCVTSSNLDEDTKSSEFFCLSDSNPIRNNFIATDRRFTAPTKRSIMINDNNQSSLKRPTALGSSQLPSNCESSPEISYNIVDNCPPPPKSLVPYMERSQDPSHPDTEILSNFTAFQYSSISPKGATSNCSTSPRHRYKPENRSPRSAYTVKSHKSEVHPDGKKPLQRDEQPLEAMRPLFHTERRSLEREGLFKSETNFGALTSAAKKVDVRISPKVPDSESFSVHEAPFRVCADEFFRIDKHASGLSQQKTLDTDMGPLHTPLRQITNEHEYMPTITSLPADVNPMRSMGTVRESEDIGLTSIDLSEFSLKPFQPEQKKIPFAGNELVVQMVDTPTHGREYSFAFEPLVHNPPKEIVGLHDTSSEALSSSSDSCLRKHRIPSSEAEVIQKRIDNNKGVSSFSEEKLPPRLIAPKKEFEEIRGIENFPSVECDRPPSSNSIFSIIKNFGCSMTENPRIIQHTTSSDSYWNEDPVSGTIRENSVFRRRWSQGNEDPQEVRSSRLDQQRANARELLANRDII